MALVRRPAGDRAMLRRMVLLADRLFALDLTVISAGATTEIAATLNRRERRLTLPGPQAAATIVDGLSPLFAGLNELVGEQGLAHRFAIHDARRSFGCYVHLLPRGDDVPTFFGALALDADDAARLPRVPRLDEIVPRRRLYESDFKCSARPSDVACLIDSIAEFAGIPEIRVELTETDGGETFDAVVTDGRHRVSARVENRKYVDLRPVLPLLDNAIARRGAPHRLYRCFGDGFQDAIARATVSEAERLAALSFLDDPYAPLAT